MATEITIALLYKNETTKAAYGQAITGLQTGFVPVRAALNGDLLTNLDAAKVDAVIVEVENEDTDFTLLERAVDELAPLPVYAAQQNLDMQALRRLMRVGVRDVLSVPPDMDEIKVEVARLEERKKNESEQRQGKVVAVMSAKSGSGATTVAVNTACELASKHESIRVALLDMNIQFGDVSLFLNMKSHSHVMEAISQASRLDATMLKTMMGVHDTGLHVLSAPPDLVRIDKVAATDVRRVVEVATQYYDVVILDLPRYLSEWSEEVLRQSDSFILVIQKSLAVLRDARMIINYLPKAGVDKDKLLVVDNRSKSKHSTISGKQVEETLSLEDVMHLANDYDAAVSSQDHGEPLLKRAKGSRLRKDIGELADDLATALLGIEMKQGHLLGRFLGKH